jgi:hypothetical protein
MLQHAGKSGAIVHEETRVTEVQFDEKSGRPISALSTRAAELASFLLKISKIASITKTSRILRPGPTGKELGHIVPTPHGQGHPGLRL